jgi:hypothetical protein
MEPLFYTLISNDCGHLEQNSILKQHRLIEQRR